MRLQEANSSLRHYDIGCAACADLTHGNGASLESRVSGVTGTGLTRRSVDTGSA